MRDEIAANEREGHKRRVSRVSVVGGYNACGGVLAVRVVVLDKDV